MAADARRDGGTRGARGTAGVAELAFCFGFPYADFADCGPALAAFADTQAEADAAADAFAAHVAARESDFRPGHPAGGRGGRRGEAPRARARRPVVLADTQDNPGGGGHGDTTELLAELVRQRREGALRLPDQRCRERRRVPCAPARAHASLSLGGKSDGMPFPCEARVLKLTDGRFTLTGPMGAGNPANLGPERADRHRRRARDGDIRKMQALDQAIIRHLGIEPANCPILALKSSVHFRADFAPIAEQVIVAIAPGPVVRTRRR